MMSEQTVFRGDRMREQRKRLHWTQEEIGKRIGVTRSQINNYELGNSEPSMRALALIAYELGVTSDWLIDLSAAARPISGDIEPIPFCEIQVSQ